MCHHAVNSWWHSATLTPVTVRCELNLGGIVPSIRIVIIMYVCNRTHTFSMEITRYKNSYKLYYLPPKVQTHGPLRMRTHVWCGGAAPRYGAGRPGFESWVSRKKTPHPWQFSELIHAAGTSWVASGPFLNPAARENFFLLQYLG
jgi:hypothetical protein